MILVKTGGGKTINLEGIITDLAELDEQCIIIHGANALRDELAVRLGIEKKVITSISGYTSVLSNETTIDLQMMAYAGLRNKRIVEMCQQKGINAVGLSGLDGKVIQGKRNAGIKIYKNKKKRIIRDFSGKPKEINVELLELLLTNGYTPVLSVPIIDEKNFAINSENDDIVNVLQQALPADKIIQLIEAPGFLDDIDNPDSLMHQMSLEELRTREAGAEGRIKRKLLAILKLFEGNSTTVIISDGRVENPIKDALAGKGTIIQ
jgi:acetylglutamate/LysW-gamma-L-alpha-aminoadipate kinase